MTTKETITANNMPLKLDVELAGFYSDKKNVSLALHIELTSLEEQPKTSFIVKGGKIGPVSYEKLQTALDHYNFLLC